MTSAMIEKIISTMIHFEIQFKKIFWCVCGRGRIFNELPGDVKNLKFKILISNRKMIQKKNKVHSLLFGT